MADLLDDHEGASSGSLEQEDDLAVSASDVSEDELGEFEPTGSVGYRRFILSALLHL